MNWEARWPFVSTESVIAHEDVYCAGFYKPRAARAVKVVDPQDWRIEEWLEAKGAGQLRQDPANRESIRSIYVWKTRANISFSKGDLAPPEDLFSVSFADALRALRDSENDAALTLAMSALQAFRGVRVRVASAFAYWLRPDDYQLIDVRSTQALSLAFSDADYTPENYARFCQVARGLAGQHRVTLRRLDRALFVYHRLLEAGYLLES